jgi:hypothetical protein
LDHSMYSSRFHLYELLVCPRRSHQVFWIVRN